MINLTDYDQQLRSALDETYRSFGKPLEIDKYEQHFARMREEGSVDFARLTASEQRAVITAAARDPQIRRLIHNANHVLASWISDTPPKNTTEANAVIDQNRAVIQEKYSASATQTSLFNIYREMIETGTEKVQPNPNPAAVLNYFLSVENFHPIRVSTNQSQGQRSTENKRLQSIVRDSLSEILPLPTGVAPKLFPLSDVKAVIFDIYGTLLVSASGDVGTDPAFSNQGKTADPQLDQMLSDYGTNLQAVSALVRSEIESKHKALRDAGIPFPEIEICSIWQAVLMELARLKAESQRSLPPMAIPSASVREIAIRSELQTNPVWKMPGFDSCLREIQNRKLALGIISNAQFYTPCIIEALAEESLRKLGFADPLSHYSFRIGRGKPDPYLYQLAAKSLQRFDLSPSQVLYVGNHVTKDMIPAKESGFRTGLFAGDKRSLRCGEHGDPQHHDSIDLIFTQLEQITTVLR